MSDVGTLCPLSVGIMNTVSTGESTSPLDALLSGQLGPITSEGLFLVMCDLMEQQNLKIAQKTDEFRSQTAIQAKYAEYLNWMQTAQSCATGEGGELLVVSKLVDGEYQPEDGGFDLRKMLTKLGYEEPYLQEAMNDIMAYQQRATINDTDVMVITPQGLGDFLNKEIFGDDNVQLHVHLDGLDYEDGEYVSGTFKRDHFNDVTEKIDSAQKENCGDTTLLTTELNQLISHQERISNMFSNMLKKFHDTEMAIIRNI